MENSISSDSQSVQFIYEDYRNQKFIVNRRYQRKLVWTVEEKQSFIDSLIRGYSVPLFLLARPIAATESDQWEILDGMQRLNTIFSFVENEFPVEYDGKEAFFDLESLASTKQLLDEGQLHQNTPTLPRSVCSSIMKYPISPCPGGRRSITVLIGIGLPMSDSAPERTPVWVTSGSVISGILKNT